MTKLNKKQKMYMGFLESLKTPKTSALIESVQQAYILAECGNNCANGECDDDVLEECGDDTVLEEGLNGPIADDYGDGEDDYDYLNYDRDLDGDVAWEPARNPVDTDGIEDGYIGDSDPDEVDFDAMADEVLARNGF